MNRQELPWFQPGMHRPGLTQFNNPAMNIPGLTQPNNPPVNRPGLTQFNLGMNRPGLTQANNPPVNRPELPQFNNPAMNRQELPWLNNPALNHAYNAPMLYQRNPVIRSINSLPPILSREINSVPGVGPIVVPFYERNEQTLYGISQADNYNAGVDTINPAYDNFNNELNNIPGFRDISNSDKLKALRPKIENLIEITRNNSNYAVSDLAELKYILSKSDKRAGLKDDTVGLYSYNPVSSAGNVITIYINDSRKKARIIEDLRNIIRDIESN